MRPSVVFRYAEEIFSLGRELTETLQGKPARSRLRLLIGIADVVPKLIAYRLLEPVLHLPEPVQLTCDERGPVDLLAELAQHRLDVGRCRLKNGPCCRQCAGQELNLHIPEAAALQAVGLANAQPTHVIQEARVGVEPTDDHEGLSFAALPVCVPRLTVRASPMGFEPGHRRGAVVLLRDRQASTPLLHEDVIGCCEWLRWESNPQHPCDHRCAAVPAFQLPAQVVVRARKNPMSLSLVTPGS